MAGRFKGAQTIIRSQHPKALYAHCAAHSLNLAVSSACNIPSIRNCLGIVEKYYCFFNFPKRNHEILEVINNGDWQPNVKSFSSLKRVKTYLRNIMKEVYYNYIYLF